jgi:YHS domain-containing protein
MEQEFLNAPDLLRKIETGFVAVKVDSDRNPDLVRRFQVAGLPTDLFIDPDGRVLVQTTGYQDRDSYLARMARTEARYDHARKVRIAKTRTGEPDESPEPTGLITDRSPSPPARLEQEGPVQANPAPRRGARPLGMDGFSPITLWNRGDWKIGLPEFAAEHKGIVNFLADASEREQFNANPERYVPRFLGCDPVVLHEPDRAVPGSTKFGAFFDGVLYLFKSDETRQRFRHDPERFIQPRHVVRINQIERPEGRY